MIRTPLAIENVDDTVSVSVNLIKLENLLKSCLKFFFYLYVYQLLPYNVPIYNNYWY